ncbi:MAG: hypothetical protein ACRDGS_09540 [Chloroflexota bacterium]
MAEAVTLALPEEIARQAREVAQRTGRQMADVLTEWLTRGAVSEGTLLLMPGVAYPIYTPYGNESAAQGLLDALHAEETTVRTDDPQR